MSRVNLIVLAVLAALTVAAASAATALAADPAEINVEQCATGNFTVLCLVLPSEPGILWMQNVNGSWEFQDQIEAGTVSTLVVEGGPNIQCKSAPSDFLLDTTVELTLSLNILALLIEFKECKVVNTAETEANCVVKEPILTNAEGTIDLPENDVVFKPIPPSTVFATITIKSVVGKTCIFAKENQKVTGEQLCEFPLISEKPEVEKDAIVHLLICSEAGSTLLYAEKSAKFALTDEIFLTKGGEWDLSTGP
jgi:hypothetical protein